MVSTLGFREVERLARIFTYHLNAWIDARVAQALLLYLRAGVPPRGDDEIALRAGELLRAVGSRRGRAARVAAVAYTLERVNGLADHRYALLLRDRLLRGREAMVDAFVRVRCPYDDIPYREIRSTPGAVLAIALRILADRRHDLEAWARRSGVGIELDARGLAAMVALVQHRNTAANQRVADELGPATGPGSVRAEALARAARATPHPRAFLRAAATAQRAASRWDGLLWLLLRARFGIGRRASQDPR